MWANWNTLDQIFHLEIQPNNAYSAPMHNLLLSIKFTTPTTGVSNSWPFSFFADGVPISLQKAETMFGVKIQMKGECECFSLRINHLHMHFSELSAICGFDPALNGTDIYDYFGLHPWEKSDIETSWYVLQYICLYTIILFLIYRLGESNSQ